MGRSSGFVALCLAPEPPRHRERRALAERYCNARANSRSRRFAVDSKLGHARRPEFEKFGPESDTRARNANAAARDHDCDVMRA
jgi:hypothetical protein